jgi:hypothetical protein
MILMLFLAAKIGESKHFPFIFFDKNAAFSELPITNVQGHSNLGLAPGKARRCSHAGDFFHPLMLFLHSTL